jgi:hypothetical protein
MMHLLWVTPLVTGLAVIWSGRLHGVALLVFLVCGSIGLVQLVRRPRGLPTAPTPHERDPRPERDVPPHPGW